MSKALFLVIQSLGSWWVDFEGKAHGPFASRQDAALEARSIARFEAHSGRVSEVLVPDEAGKFWVIWSSRHDADHQGSSFVPHRITG
jgi:hypothetical protein